MLFTTMYFVHRLGIAKSRNHFMALVKQVHESELSSLDELTVACYYDDCVAIYDIIADYVHTFLESITSLVTNYEHQFARMFHDIRENMGIPFSPALNHIA